MHSGLRIRRRAAALSFLCLGLLSGPVGAAPPEPPLRPPALNVHRFKPAAHARDLLGLAGSQVNRRFTLAAEFLYGAAGNVLVVESAGGPWADTPARRQVVLRQLHTADLWLAVSFLGRLSIGLDLPLLLGAQGERAGLVPLANVRSAGLGDLRLAVKGTLLDSGRRGFGVALELAPSAPTAQAGGFVGEPGFTLAARAIVDYEHWGPRVTLNVGYLTRFGAVARFGQARIYDEAAKRWLSVGAAPIETADELSFGLGGAWPLFKDRLEPIVEIEAATRVDRFFSDQANRHLELRAGLRYSMEREVRVPLRLTLAAGTGLLEGYGEPAWRVLAGFGYVPRTLEPPDRDRDGIPDREDECPNEPEDPDVYFDRDGCPDPDNDGDGVLDAADRCPNTAEDRDGFNDDDGCPEGDNDGDGIEDGADLCRNAAEDRDGFEDDDGCPDYDNDMDGIPDQQDRCPNEAETRNGHLDADGCPDERPVSVADGKLVWQGDIRFAPASDAVDEAAAAQIAKVAQALNEHPEIGLVRIDVATNEMARAEELQALTERRAEAIKAELVRRGVAGDRLETNGLGQEADSFVEFIVVQQKKSRRGR